MIFYRSRRVGKGGKEFFMLKFRTLVNGSDKQVFSNEATYTRFGKFLRKHKLDEVPQIVNVLRGEMSLCGPRPEEARNIDVLPFDLREQILSVKPGITSLSAIHFFDEERILAESENISRDFWVKVKPMKILLDIWYVQHKNWLIDLGLILATVKRIIFKH